MNHQDQYQFDPTTTAPYTVFRQVGSKTYFVNSKCIQAKQKRITVGEEYLLIDSSKNIVRKASSCILVDCYYREGILHLILRDRRSQKVFTLDHNIQFPERNCTWLFFDVKYYVNRINFKTIQSYCGCDNDAKKKTNSEFSHKSNHEDLLDFEF